MKREEIEKFQLAQLNLLRWFDKKCRSLNLRYYLAYGSLLGAVRHGKSIPWDADIDVIMHRREYEAFKEYMISNPDEKVFYDHYLTDPKLYSPHAILRINGTRVIYNERHEEKYEALYNGVFIDIFPLDEFPDDKVHQERIRKKLVRADHFLTVRMGNYVENDSKIKALCKKIASKVLKCFPLIMINRYRDQLIQSFNGKNTKNVSTMVDVRAFYKLVFPKDMFDEPSEIMFSGFSFMAPCDPIKFLEIRYGEYLKLPPDNERWRYLDDVIVDVDYGNIDNFEEYLELKR